MRLLTLLFSLALCAATASYAGEAKPLAQDPAVEARLQNISKELRCLVCQNETLADSHAALAEDLRVEVRELIKKGNSDQEVKDYLVARYGDFVLYRPKVAPSTWVLWFGPFLLLIAGIFGLLKFLKRRSSTEVVSELTAEQKARAAELLKQGDKV